MDESSSNVDLDTDRIMQQIIREEFERYTIVMVNHRLENILDFDTVLVMENGRVIEVGQPKMLGEKDRSRFKDLWLIG